MRRGFGVYARVLLAGIVAALALSMPAFAGESCTSEPDSAPNSHPGVVLGPATKCVKDDGTTTSQVPAGATRPGEGATISWATFAVAGIVVAGFVMGVAQVRRRVDGRPEQSARAA